MATVMPIIDDAYARQPTEEVPRDEPFDVNTMVLFWDLQDLIGLPSELFSIMQQT